MREGWAIKPLGDVCTVIAGQSPEGSSYNSEGVGVPFYQGKKEFGEKFIGPPTTWTSDPTKGAEAGDILMSVRAPVGPINFATQNICIGRGLAAIRARDSIDRNFLFYQLLSREGEISGRDGAVFPSISRGEICAINLVIPPLPDQRCTVAILDEAFEAIATATANTEKNLANVQELSDSLFDRCLENGGDGWKEQALEKLVTADCSLSYGIVQPGEEMPNGLPIVRPTDLDQQVITLEGLKRINASAAKGYDRTKLKGGELLLCVRGSTGVFSIASDELSGANVTRGIVPIRFDSSKVLQRFGYYLFLSTSVQKQIKTKTYGTTLMQINIRDLKQISVHFPSLKEQKQLISLLDGLAAQLKGLEVLCRRKLVKLTLLKETILRKAFSGDLTSLPSSNLDAAAE